MNEKIKQIRQKAVDEINCQFFSCPENIEELINQRFAELIVMECAKISEEYAWHSKATALFISDEIKNRFDV